MLRAWPPAWQQPSSEQPSWRLGLAAGFAAGFCSGLGMAGFSAAGFFAAAAFRAALLGSMDLAAAFFGTAFSSYFGSSLLRAAFFTAGLQQPLLAYLHLAAAFFGSPLHCRLNRYWRSLLRSQQQPLRSSLHRHLAAASLRAAFFTAGLAAAFGAASLHCRLRQQPSGRPSSPPFGSSLSHCRLSRSLPWEQPSQPVWRRVSALACHGYLLLDSENKYSRLNQAQNAIRPNRPGPSDHRRVSGTIEFTSSIISRNSD